MATKKKKTTTGPFACPFEAPPPAPSPPAVVAEATPLTAREVFERSKRKKK